MYLGVGIVPTDDELLGDMLLRWDELREQGQTPSPEELCREHPHLLPELTRRIDALRAMSWIDESVEPEDHGVPPPPLRDDPQPEVHRLGGRYRLDRLIAEGGSGQVWQGYDEELQRPVAVKVPRPSRSTARPPVDFLAEGRRVARLEHPGIVPVYDVGQDDGRYYIVSKLVDGESLADRLRRGPVPPADAARLVAEVARTLEFAHKQGYIHRDIKPANVLLDPEGRPFLADFGIAIRPPELLTASRVGTLAYMSPEQLTGEVHRLDARTDIYGLGVVLYEALTGRQLFRDENPVALREAITGGVYPTPRTVNRAIPATLDRIVMRCLARNPDDRYATAGELADALDACTRSPGPTRTRKYLLVASLVTLVAVLVPFIVYLYRPDSTAGPPASTGSGSPGPTSAPVPAPAPAASFGGAAEEGRVLLGHQRQVSAVAVRSGGTWVASGGADRTARLWDISKGDPAGGHLILRHPAAVTAVAFRPNGTALAAGCEDGRVAMWDVSGPEPKETAVYPGHTGAITTLAFSPDGMTMVSAGVDGRVVLRDFNFTPPKVGQFPKVEAPALTAAVAAGGDRLVLGYGDRGKQPAAFYFWGIDPKNRSNVHHRGTGPLTGATGVRTMAVSRDGVYLLAALTTQVGVWKYIPEKNEFTVLGAFEKHLGEINTVAISEDGRRAVSGGDDKIINLWEAVTLKPIRTFQGHTGGVTSVGFSSDGKLLVSAGEDGTVRLWETTD